MRIIYLGHRDQLHRVRLGKLIFPTYVILAHTYVEIQSVSDALELNWDKTESWLLRDRNIDLSLIRAPHDKMRLCSSLTGIDDFLHKLDGRDVTKRLHHRFRRFKDDLVLDICEYCGAIA